ncbi:MAG: exodeoxyribonuclease VII large subunit [Pseudomonadales bacterium]|jgi:exodeoxyribonuclease VII large subunit|nr:exodeoxyribonuclease VII large subunit [Pseudomonadales bacterium]
MPAFTPPLGVSDSPALSVTQLNRLARQLLEEHFPAVLVEGEISNLALPGSGHWYFTLKDAGAQVRCAMFRNRNMFVRLRPRDGMQVLVKARLSLYEGRGDYQLIVESLEETGAGALRRAFELLKQKLQQEGLFAPERKRPLPSLPRHIAVITSPTGAAIRDVLSVLRRRFPATLVTIVPVQVQGQSSAAELTAALERVNRQQGCLADVDVILLTRGGGSLEDLWSFNDETLARAIAASRLPVVSAVGHEVDFSIADFVADLRAPTPSAAAELLSPHQDDYRQLLRTWQARLRTLCNAKLAQAQRQLAALGRHLRHPGRRLQQQAQRLDELELRLRRALLARHGVLQRRLQLALLRHGQQAPAQRIARQQENLRQSLQRLRRAMLHRLRYGRQQVAAQSQALHSVSPLGTLARGYSITRDDKGAVLRSQQQVTDGATIETQLAQGKLFSQVLRREPYSVFCGYHASTRARIFFIIP